MSSYQGRLELTWTNKPLRLLAHEDGRYEWVSPSDYRVAEVRLLDDVAAVGEVGPELLPAELFGDDPAGLAGDVTAALDGDAA